MSVFTLLLMEKKLARSQNLDLGTTMCAPSPNASQLLLKVLDKRNVDGCSMCRARSGQQRRPLGPIADVMPLALIHEELAQPRGSPCLNPLSGSCSEGMPSSWPSFRTAARRAPGTAPEATSASQSSSRSGASASGWLQQVLVHTRGKVIFDAARCCSSRRPAGGVRQDGKSRFALATAGRAPS